MKANHDLREKAKNSGIFLWEIAEELKVSESYFSRTLRKELSKKKKETCLQAIDRLIQRRPERGE